jgi:hypothetical protein
MIPRNTGWIGGDVDADGTGRDERESLLTRPFLIVTGSALFFFVYIGMLIPIVPLFIEGPLGAGEFGIG